jgi:hypothetical protein
VTSPDRTSRLVVALALLGLGLRLAALPLPGTGDVTAFKIWTHAAATGPVPEMYGVGGSPPERRLHDYDGRQATVNYPPVALYELAFVGGLYRAVFPGFPDSAVLTAAVKLLPVAAEVGVVWLLGWSVRRFVPGRPDMARFAMLAFWLNPAVVLTSAVLGYVDALFALPALGALVAASQGHAALSGVLLALAVLTKPQAIFIAPVVALALLAGPGPGRTFRTLKAMALGSGGAALSAAFVLGPVVSAGAWANFRQAMLSFGRHDMLSGQAANLWWIVTYVMRAIYAVPDLGVAGAIFSPVRRPLGISTIVGLGYPNPRLAASLAVVVAAAWGLWAGRKVRDFPRLALLGAWVCYSYFMLAVQVHENHFFMILPLLALTAAVVPEWRRLFWILSVIFALNLYLFYGLGERVGFGVSRRITGLDATVWLSIANVAAFIGFGRRLRRCLAWPEPAVTSGPEGIPRPQESSSR